MDVPSAEMTAMAKNVEKQKTFSSVGVVGRMGVKLSVRERESE